MKASEATRLVDMLSAYWPSAEMPDETAVLWSRELLPHDAEDVMEAIEIIGPRRQWMPSLAELMGVVRECRTDRLAQQARALPAKHDALSFAEFLNLNPEWKERVLALDTRDPFQPKQRSLMSAAFGRLLVEKR